MRSYKMAVYSTSLTDRTVRQVIENTKEEIERGADVYSFHELTLKILPALFRQR